MTLEPATNRFTLICYLIQRNVDERSMDPPSSPPRTPNPQVSGSHPDGHTRASAGIFRFGGDFIVRRWIHRSSG